MDKFLTYLGGVIGGFALIRIPVADTVLSSLDPIFDIIGSIAVIVFAGALIVRGINSLFSR